jgi:hypothetical protein
MTINFTESDLEAIRKVIQEELSKMKTSLSQSKDPELLTRDEVCSRLGIDRSTYHKHVKLGKLKVKKVGNKVMVLT